MTTMTAYAEALRLYHLAAAEWLGLDPHKVVSLKVDRGRPPVFTETGLDSGRYVEVSWTSVDEILTPRTGHVRPPSVSGDGETTRFGGCVALDDQDGAALLEHIGPEPEMFTPAERERLAQAFPGHVERP